MSLWCRRSEERCTQELSEAFGILRSLPGLRHRVHNAICLILFHRRHFYHSPRSHEVVAPAEMAFKLQTYVPDQYLVGRAV